MAWKGEYNGATQYTNGDEVYKVISEKTRYFIYINSKPATGIDPTHSAHWAEASIVLYNADDTVRKLLIVDDNSYRIRSIMGDIQVLLYFSSPEHIEIPVGCYINFQGARYTLERPEALKMQHSRLFNYTVLFEGESTRAKRWKFRNTVDGRLIFSLTATPREHLQMFVENMNRRDSGWQIGSCIEGTERLINYDQAYCYEALEQIAKTFDTEFEFVNKTVSLRKVEYNKSNPLPLSYGKGNGFKANIGRTNSSDAPPVEILFVQGGERNIDRSKYGHKMLRLPINQTIGFDGNKFSDEDGYNSANGRMYVTSSDGLSIQRYDKPLASKTEDSLDCSHIYPKRVGKVGQVITVDAESHFYDFTDADAASDPCPNFEQHQIGGERITVIFQSGMLAGREFEVNYFHEPTTVRGTTKVGRRFEIVPQEIDGITMPDNTFKPAPNDTYVVYNCALPQSYICDNGSKSGASWIMFREGVKYLYVAEDNKFTFTGILDGIWAKNDWLNIGGKIVLGGYIRFTDARFQADPVLVRIVTIKDYINDPHSPEITLSNEVVVSGFVSQMKMVAGDAEVVAGDNLGQSLGYTKRRFRDAQETLRLLEQSLVEGFTESISPIAAQMLQLLVGDDSLQFRFVNNPSVANPVKISPNFNYYPSTGIFSIDGGYYLQHLTLGVKNIKPTHEVTEFKWWQVQSFQTPALADPDQKFYLYLRCPEQGSTSCHYVLSDTAIGMREEAGYYHLFVGVLNSEYEGDRSFTALYGFTEITGGRITTDRVVSKDGNTFFDLEANAFRLADKLQFNIDGNGNLVLNGTFVQSGSGDITVIGAYCGAYDPARTYKLGDEVTHTVDGVTISYRYINSEAKAGMPLTDDNYWEIYAKGVDGVDGQSIIWKGESATPPANPLPNWCYRNTNNGIVYIWDGSAWAVMTHDGADGADGADGVDGAAGTSIVWKGSFSTHPANPQNGWAYYNAAQKKSFVYQSGAWYQMTIDGVDGQNGANGLSIVWKGESSSPPSYPRTNWCYRDTDNGRVYIWNGTAWALMTRDGDDGADGADGADGLSVYITYHDNPATSMPSTPTGSGTTGGWHTNPTAASVWISQKVAASASSGSWGTPIRIKGADGTNGQDGVDGQDGNGISATIITYTTSSSGTTPPTSGWNSNIPSCPAGFFLWTKTMITFTNGTSSTQYTVSRQGVDGTAGAAGQDGKSPACPYVGVYNNSKVYHGNSIRCDIVYYSNRYYIAKPTAGVFSGKYPTNTSYWNDFGASFDSIATGFIFAEQAVLENAVVRILKTAESGSRIEAIGNSLSMFDTSGALKLKIMGDVLGATPSSGSATISSQTVQNGSHDNSQYRNMFRVTGKVNVATFTAQAAANSVTLPNLSMRVTLAATSGSILEGEALGEWEIWYEIDGQAVTYGDMQQCSVMQGSTSNYRNFTLAGTTLSVAQGSHTVSVAWAYMGSGSSGYNEASNSTRSTAQILSTAYITISYPIQKTEIGSNGFRVMFGSNYMFQCIKSGSADSTIEFLMRAGNYGLKVNSSGLYKMDNGYSWVTL